MIRWQRADIAAGAVVGILLLLMWQSLSAGWRSMVTAITAALPGNTEVYGPTGASEVLPLAIAVIVACPLPIGRRLFFVAIATAVTLSCETVLILTTAWLHLPIGLLQVLGGIVHNILPLAMVVLALQEARTPAVRHVG